MKRLAYGFWKGEMATFGERVIFNVAFGQNLLFHVWVISPACPAINTSLKKKNPGLSPKQNLSVAPTCTG